MTSYDALEPKSVDPMDGVVSSLQPRSADSLMGNLAEPEGPQPSSLDDATGGDALAGLPFVPPPAEEPDAPDAAFKPGALEFRGVKWATPGRDGERTFENSPGFYEVDYDPTGRRGEAKGLTGIQAANVFGRQFSRDELMRDEEGRRLVTLMEKRRTGEHREEGFLAGLTDFRDMSYSGRGNRLDAGTYRKALADIPFLGWMVDAGSTVSETISMSKAMRKMQNGEAVTDHEALAVRRYMLQQQMESERNWRYQVGSLIHSSIPFMVEMGLSSTLVAGAAAAGAAVGGPIGAIIAGGGALLFGGIGRLFTKAGRASLGLASRTVANEAVRGYAKRTFAEGFTREMSNEIVRHSVAASGLTAKALVRDASAVGSERAMLALAADAAAKSRGAAAAAKMTPAELLQFAQRSGIGGAELKRRSKFETLKYLSERYGTSMRDDVDTRLARHLMVEGDAVNLFDSGLRSALEKRLMVGATKETGYVARQRILRERMQDFFKDGAKVAEFRKQYVDGFVEAGTKGASAGHRLPLPGAEHLGSDIVRDSMSRVLGNVGVNNTVSHRVADQMAEYALRSLELQYGGSWFGANAGRRFWRWFSDGALDGMLRWDMSMLGGIGTLARSGTALGGKMAALKEAMKVAFVEAPVRGAMQLGSQVPLWPAAAAATGNSPGDFVVRGQLGIQSQALMTGDEELMDNARALAIGAGLVEYASENAGRGINLAISGALAPVAKSAAEGLLPEATKDLGSWLSKRIAAAYGSGTLMTDANRKLVAQGMYSRIGAKLADYAKSHPGASLPSVPYSEVSQMVASRSAKGLTGIQAFMRATGTTERELVNNAMRTGLGLSKTRAAIAYFTSYYMMRHGITPQRMAETLERVGYDGVIGEMLEERYGGFFQGLFGLNERPSDETFRERWSAAMDGLFPDKKQLVVEALGFAFPAVSHASMNALYSGLGRGFTGELRASANALSQSMSSVPVLSIGGLSAAHAAQIQDWQKAALDIQDRNFGTEADNRAKAQGRAEQLFADVSGRRYAPSAKNADLKSAKSVDEMKALLDAKADMIVSLADGDAAELERLLGEYDAQRVFGVDGVEAVRNLARRGGMVDKKSEAVYGADGEYGRHMVKGRELLLAASAGTPATVDDAANDVTVQLPSLAKDTSVVAGETGRFGGDTRETRVNGFSDDIVGDFARHMDTLAKAALRYQVQAAAKGSWLGRHVRSGLMRLTGIVNAIQTGDLAMAARNPVQWAMQDAGLPADLMTQLGSLYKDSIMVGRQRVIDGLAENTHERRSHEEKTDISDFDGEMLKKYEDAGADYYRERLQEFARQYLAARNVIAVSRSDLTEQAIRVAAGRMKNEDAAGKVTYGPARVEDFHDPKFTNDPAVRQEVEKARREIVGALAEQATKGAIAYNTHAGFGLENVTQAAFDYRRAMQYGTQPEILAAIRQLPAFRALHPVHDLSNGAALGDDFGGAAGRVGDVDTLIQLPDDSRSWTEAQMRDVLVAMGVPYGTRTAAENARSAETWLRRMKAAVAQQAPVAVLQGGTEVPATFSQAYAKDGTRVVTASVYDENGVLVARQEAPDYVSLAQALRVAGYDCQMPRVVLMEDATFASRDATSMAQFLLGDRMAARRYFQDRFGINEERFFPPWLRMKGGDFQFTAAEAAEELAKELRAAARGDEAAKLATEGSGKVGDPFRWGYESAARKYLEDRQIRRSATQNRFARTVLGEASYAVNPSGLPVGNTLFVTSNFYSEGDGEALLRSALAQAIYNSIMDAHAQDDARFDHLMNVYREMDAAFTAAADDVAAELDESDPKAARRVRAAMESIGSESDAGRLSPGRLSAMAASMAFFTSDRGVAGEGNGYLLSPELALVADRARTSKWAPLFFSAVDRALGGTGLFEGDGRYRGLRSLIAAFSPTTQEITDARASAIFSPNGEKAPVNFPEIRWTVEPGEGGGSILAPAVSATAIDGKTLETVERGAFMRVVADNCREFADAFKATTGRDLTDAEMFRLLKQADVKGGDAGTPGAKPSIRMEPRTVNVNGVHHTLPATGTTAPLEADVISDETAFAVARSLRFLSPRTAETTVSAEQGRVAAREARDAIVNFLLSCGMSVENVNRVVLQARNAFGADDRAAPAEDASDDVERDEVADEVSATGNAELAQAEHASNAVVTSRDMLGLAEQLRYVFPTEGGNYTAVLSELAEEMYRAAQDVLAEVGGDVKQASERWEYLLGRYFNTLRWPRSGLASSEVALAQPWDDNAVTDRLLDYAISYFHGKGRDSFAFALSAIRHMDARGKRRTQALRQIACMDQHDVNELTVVPSENGVRVDMGPNRTGGRAPLAAVRASLRHLVLSPVLRTRHPGWSRANQAKELQAVLSGLFALNNDNGYREVNWQNRWGRPNKGKTFGDALEGKSVAEFDAKIARAVKDQSALVKKVQAVAASRHALTADEHATLVEFGNEFAARYASVADAIDYLFGEDNEVCRAMRSRDLARRVVAEIEDVLSPASGMKWDVGEKIVKRVLTDFLDTGANSPRTKIKSTLFSRLVVDPIRAAVVVAAKARGARGDIDADRGMMAENGVASAGLVQSDLLSATMDPRFEMLVYHTNIVGNVPKGVTALADMDLDKFLASPDTYGSALRSQLTRIIERFGLSLPRSTGRLAGQNSDDIAESANVTAVTPSPEPVQDRIVDRVFSHLTVDGVKLKESFLSAGRRFADGTRLVTVCAGAKLGEAVVDKANLSMLVYRANRQRFEDDGDTRNIFFELYHGEKPTVLSLNLPGYVADALLAEIAANAEWTRNPNLAKLREQGELPASLAEMKPEQRARTYDALFSVLAKQGGFQHITTKRTQVILSNATPVAAHRDYIDYVDADGEVQRRPAKSVNLKTGEKVTPGMHMCISLAGADATQDMGMYFHWGWVAEGQCKLQTNPKAISHKNHGLSRDREMLTKGQGHAIGLGLYEGETRWTSGVFRAAQRRGRRKLERLLGLDDGILELPDEAQKADAELMAKRAAAMEAVEEFARHSSLLFSDKETQKCGPLAAGSGFRVDAEGDAIHAKVGGKDVWVRVKNGRWEGKAEEKGEFLPLQYRTVPEFKGGAYAIPETVPAMLEALGLDHLDEKDVFDRKAKTGIESDWVDASGAKSSGLIGSSGLFHSMGTEKGDRLSFCKDGDGEWECDFFLRDFEAQVMANSDAPSKLSHEHPAATNYQRDVVANARRARRGDGAAMAVVAARMMPYLVSRAYPAEFEEQVLARDSEFTALQKANPNSEHVRIQYARKRDALLAKLQRAYVSSTHAVLCGSGIKCSFSRKPDGTFDIAYEYSAGVTDYDKDTFRPARVIPGFAREVMGSNRTYSTMRANVSGDARFRYGWHVDEAKVMEALRPLLDRGFQDRFDYERGVLEGVYRRQEGGLFLHPDGDNVTDSELDAMAAVATLVRAVDDRSSDTEATALAREALAKSVVDYTGRYLADNKAADIARISFEDLFTWRRGVKRFDYAAFECGSHRRMTPEGSALEGRTLFLGGSFFSGDRRPSGNFEAAAGFARVQAPVNFDEATGRVGPQGLYILDPAMCKTQGSDTDGDSATATGKDGRVTDTDIAFFKRVVDGLDQFAKRYLQPGEGDGIRADLGLAARDFLEKLYENKAYRRYFTAETDPVTGAVSLQLSENFNRLVGNILLDAQGMNFRDLPTLVNHDDGTLTDAGDTTDSEVLAVELNGMSGVGPSVMKVPSPAEGGPSFPQSGELADLYRKATGKAVPDGLSYDDAFKNAINGITGKVKPDLLSAYDHAMFSAEATDGSGARGVMVSIQAAIEHMAGFDADRARDVAPGLYSNVERRCVPFVARLDGISNALFDVVKDLFAPRCGWRKNMLNYLVARLMGRVEEQYAAREDGTPPPPIDAGWFFRELVGYALELHRSPTSVAGLLGLNHAWNNYEETDRYTGRRTAVGVFRDHWDDPLVQLFLSPESQGIAWHPDDQVPDIVAFGARGNGAPNLYGDTFFEAFTDRVAEVARRQARNMRKALGGGSVKRFLVANALGAVRQLVPDAYSKARTDEERMALAERVFTVLSGRSLDGPDYRVGRDMQFAIMGSVLFGGAEGVEDRVFAAERAIADMRRFDTLMELEDPLSADSTFQRGGKKVGSLLRKMDRSVERGVVDMDCMPIRVQYAMAWMRLRDMAGDSVHPATMAKNAAGDLGTLGEIAERNDAEAMRAYARENVLALPRRTKPELQRVALAQMLVRNRAASVGTMLENFGYVQHLPGAIKLALGSRSVDGLYKLMQGDCGRNVVQVVQRLAEESVREVENGITTSEGALPAEVTALFRLLRVDAQTGRIDFVAKLGPEEARIAREGFRALKAFKGLVWDIDADSAREFEERFQRIRGYGQVRFPVGQLTGRDLADLMRIEIARTVHFDAADELDARANIVQLFGDEANEMERWGVAASRNLALRALLRMPLAGTERNKPDMPRGFDLFAGTTFNDAAAARDYCLDVAKLSLDDLADTLGVERLDTTDYAEIMGMTPFDLIADSVTETDSLHGAHEAAPKADPALVAQREQPAPVSSPFEQSESWDADFRLVPRTRVAGVRFVVDTGDGKAEADSLEEAVNLHVEAVAAALRADPRFAALDAGDAKFAWELATRLGEGGQSLRAFADRVIADTLADQRYGETLSQWLADADSRPESLVDPLAHRMLRDALHSAALGGNTEAAPAKPRLAPRVARPGMSAPSITMTRMKRSGFLDYVKAKDPEMYRRMSKNPLEGIRAGLEKAFGKWSDETGVKVERVTRRTDDGKYVPVNLIRVTRKVKDRGGVRNVVTYISFGDAIPMQMASREYMASMLEAVNSALEPGMRPMAMSDLESMTEAQRLALANSLNLRVMGESRSRKCVSTDCLLAMTGLVRLSDAADYHTLFHEYFHQALDFYRETGVCTDADLAALTKRYRRSDGQLDEEAAADAFAAYLLQDDPSVGTKLLADGAGDRDRIFEKFKHTAQAYLSGALGYNNRGIPVFMKMMISGDFSDREMQHAEKVTREKLRDLEKAMLEDDFDYGFDENYESPEATPGLHEARLGVQNAVLGFRHGTTTAHDLAQAAQRLVDELRKPGNKIVFDGVLSLYRLDEPLPEKGALPKETPLEVKLRDESIPAADRASLFLRAALDRFGAGALAPEYAALMPRLMDVASWGADEITASHVSLAESTARRIIQQMGDVLGLDFEEIDASGNVKLNALGETLVSDARVAELALRLLQEGTRRLQDAPPKPGERRRTHASAADVVGSALMAVAPNRWGAYASEQAGLASDKFAEAAEDCRARAAALRRRAPVPTDADEREARALEEQAETLDKRARLAARVISALARGEDMSRVLPAGEGRRGSLYDHVVRFLLDSSERVELANGHARWSKGENSRLGLDYGARHLQVALDATANAVAIAAVVRRWARENGVEMPAVGADVELPESPVEPPAEGVMEPDATPQVILQSPGSWLAADLYRRFAGTNLRDMMTDTTLQALIEESNRLAQNIVFLFGANVEWGSSLNRITTKTSRLGLNDLGEMTVSDDKAHAVQSVAAVRGRLLGLVNLQAEQVGEKFTADDVNNVNLALQLVTGIMQGEPMYTGYDVGIMSVSRIRELMGGTAAGRVQAYTTAGSSFHYRSVLGRYTGRLNESKRPTNLDILLGRMIEGLGLEFLGYDKASDSFRADGLYCKVLDAFLKRAFDTTTDESTGKERKLTDAEYWDSVQKALRRAGLVDTSETGKSVLTVPVELGRAAWLRSDTYRKLVDAGRDPGLLDLDRVAAVLTADVHRLHRAAAKSGYLRDFEGAALSSAARPGLFFEAGTGFHRLVGDSYADARSRFLGRPSSDEVLRSQFRSLQETIDRDERVHLVYQRDPVTGKVVKDADGKPVVVDAWRLGDRLAFERNADGLLVNVSTRKVQFLGRLLGFGSRISGDGLQAFLDRVQSGQFERENGTDPYGFDIRRDMTVAELDRAVFGIVSTLLTEEALGRKTSLTASDADGGLGYDDQQLVDLAEMNRRLGEKLMAVAESDETAKGRVCSLSDGQMFRTFGMTGSSRTAPERLMSMAESIVHAERFRGCLAQMLTTVSQDGTPNYVVNPTDRAAEFLPDEFWEATAKFVAGKLRRSGYALPQYDAGRSGVENMQMVAKAVGEAVQASDAKAKAHVKLHLLPPDKLAAQGMFSAIYCHDDAEDAAAPNAIVGGEAAGYMKQLFGTLRAPSRANAWRNLDRVMAYSKAASVGLSTFFAIATRFESPVAACGFVATVGGYTQRTADLLRRLGRTRAGKLLGLEEDGAYLADFLNSLTSNDPAIRDMRMLLDAIGMPLADAVQNPMDGQLGNIDSDIKRISNAIASIAAETETGGLGARLAGKAAASLGKEVRDALRAAFHNPGEYAFSNILAGVKMAVVAQTLHRLRRECESAQRPFDPIRELRRHSAYINAEIGGIQAERYAWLTPGMQRFLRLAMFSYNWTLGAWVAGTGEVVTDLLLGGHSTTPASRQRAFVRWLRMLGIVKVGVPFAAQLVVKGVAKMLTDFGIVGDPDDDGDDPLGIANMPWLCFNNESKIGALSIDVTPILKLCGRSKTLRDMRLGRGSWPVVTTAAGALTLPAAGGIAGFLTGGMRGLVQGVRRNSGAFSLLAGGALGRLFGKAVPAYVDTGRGANTSGRRRNYLHFGKQNDEFWRWFTDFYGQLTNKMSIPMQKTVEAFFGSTNGSNFGKKFDDMSLVDRFFTTSLDPDENAIVNWLTAFVPFSAASVAAHPDAGVFGMMAPVQMGMSKTLGQKRIKARLMEFAEQDGAPDVWAAGRNRRDLRILCADIFREAALNGMDPKELLQSARGEAMSAEYARLFTCLPREADDEFDTKRAMQALRALWRLNGKLSGLKQSLAKKYRAANVDWSQQENKWLRKAVMDFAKWSRRNPFGRPDEEMFRKYFEAYDPRKVRQADRGGDALANFLAKDDVPETLFGFPVVAHDYTEADLEFFRQNPDAGGYYDLGDEGGDEGPEPLPPKGGGPTQGDLLGGKTEDQLWAERNPTLLNHVKSFEKLRLEPYEDVGGYAIGYGAHLDKDGATVTADTTKITEAQADSMLARDLYARREALSKTLPNWASMPGEARQALLDVSMGRDDILSKERSPGLHGDLAAAGGDSAKLLAAVKKHYYSYRTSERPEDQKGLENRRVAGGRAFFNEEFSYEGRTWDPKLGFVTTAR